VSFTKVNFNVLYQNNKRPYRFFYKLKLTVKNKKKIEEIICKRVFFSNEFIHKVILNFFKKLEFKFSDFSFLYNSWKN